MKGRRLPNLEVHRSLQAPNRGCSRNPETEQAGLRLQRHRDAECSHSPGATCKQISQRHRNIRATSPGLTAGAQAANRLCRPELPRTFFSPRSVYKEAVPLGPSLGAHAPLLPPPAASTAQLLCWQLDDIIPGSAKRLSYPPVQTKGLRRQDVTGHTCVFPQPHANEGNLTPPLSPQVPQAASAEASGSFRRFPEALRHRGSPRMGLMNHTRL